MYRLLLGIWKTVVGTIQTHTHTHTYTHLFLSTHSDGRNLLTPCIVNLRVGYFSMRKNSLQYLLFFSRFIVLPKTVSVAGSSWNFVWETDHLGGSDQTTNLLLEDWISGRNRSWFFRNLISAQNVWKNGEKMHKKIIVRVGAGNEGSPVGCGDCPLLGGWRVSGCADIRRILFCLFLYESMQPNNLWIFCSSPCSWRLFFSQHLYHVFFPRYIICPSVPCP